MVYTVDDRRRAFVEEYLEAALWASTDDDGEPLDNRYGVWDIETRARETMVEEATAFFNAHHSLWADDMSTCRNAGNDFWLTRNYHGSGFWDMTEIYGENAKELTDLAHACGERTLYVGDDGRIYQAWG